jgi:cytochrome c553
MHTTGNAWISSHQNAAKGTGATACSYCHGTDYRGTVLSQVKMSKTFKVENGNKIFSANQKVGCYDCHNGPKGG